MTSELADDLRITVSSEQESAGASGLCCGSGCTVCVNDYPEPASAGHEPAEERTAETAELLDAIRLAHALLDELRSGSAQSEIETEGDR